ncbi:MAG: hypothetical protein Kow0013_04450 [Pararhodobacter sp.]
MFDDQPLELAVHGERGIDLFLRLDDTTEKRARFRCIATLTEDGTLADFEPEARRDGARLTSLARAAMESPALGTAFSLNDTRGWPRPGPGTDPMRLFLHHEFFRAWQVTELGARRFLDRLTRSPGDLPAQPGALAGAVAPLFAFNRLSHGVEAARLLVPALRPRVGAPAWREGETGATGYALRMLGDLCTRAGDHALALACHETAVLAGDNPFRRRKAIEAAHALGDSAARDLHLDAYARRWPLPADLAALKTTEVR